MEDEAVLLRARGLTVAVRSGRDTVPAVGPVDLEIRRDGITAILGESGSGKSLLALALGWLAPAGATLGGSVRIGDSELSTLPEKRLARVRGRRIGFVLQEPATALDPLYSIGFHLREVLSVHHGTRRREADRRAAALLSELGFGDPEAILRSFPHQLSGGQRQRVVMALALLPEPELLVADEPTASVDPLIGARILGHLVRWRASRNASLVLVTHELGTARRMADEVVILYAGEVVESGPAPVVLSRPLHPYTRFLAGEAGALSAPDLPPPGPGTWETGCRLRPRCAFARPSCAALHPSLVESGGRFVRCPPAADGGLGP